MLLHLSRVVLPVNKTEFSLVVVFPSPKEKGSIFVTTFLHKGIGSCVTRFLKATLKINGEQVGGGSGFVSQSDAFGGFLGLYQYVTYLHDR